MSLLERVTTLIRANLNDLIEQAEDPEKTMRQVILDMQNQLLQVKTQVAIAIADQHVLERRLQENEENERQWRRRAEMAVDKGDDPLARAALERSLSHQSLAEGVRGQIEDQKIQVENLKTALANLQQKLTEAEARCDSLIAQHRRSRTLGKAADASLAIGDESKLAALERMNSKVRHGEAAAQAKSQLLTGNVEQRFESMEKQEEIDRLLSDLKSKRKAG